jgi:hypothetical protein
LDFIPISFPISTYELLDISDYVKPAYLIKNTGSNTNAVYVTDPSLARGDIMDSASSEINGLRIDMGNEFNALYWSGVNHYTPKGGE